VDCTLYTYTSIYSHNNTVSATKMFGQSPAEWRLRHTYACVATLTSLECRQFARLEMGAFN